jgi:hypothetical protein
MCNLFRIVAMFTTMFVALWLPLFFIGLVARIIFGGF